ncbi:MAG: mechanosensitive ion channel [Gammaproteobacteria bacterium]|nr:mechanosensitive ion channel [Gammaproteobacteria bacterium]
MERPDCGYIVRAWRAHRMQQRRCIAAWMLAAVFTGLQLVPAAQGAEPDSAGHSIAAAGRQLDRIERQLAATSPDLGHLAVWADEASRVKSRADHCVSAISRIAGGSNLGLTGSGQLLRGAPGKTASPREILRKERLAQDEQLAACQLLSLRAGQLLHRIGQRQRALLAAQLLARGATFAGLLRDNWGQPGTWASTTATFLVEHSGVAQLTSDELWFLGALVVATAVTGMLLRRRLSSWTAHRRWADSFSGGLAMSLATSVARYLPYLFASAAVAVALGLATGGRRPPLFANLAAYGLPAYFLALASIRLFLAPTPPARPFVALPPQTARALAVRLRVLALLGYIGYLGFGALLEQNLPTPALLLARGAFFVGLTLNVLWIVWLIAHIGRLSRLRGLRTFLVLVLTGAMMSEVLGYRNLSVAVLRIVTSTLLVSGLLVLAGRLTGELFDQLNAGLNPWQRRLRESLDLAPEQPIPGLIWLRITAFILLWIAFLFVLLRAWGLSNAALIEVRSYVAGGFMVGSLQVFPVRILLALATFVVLFVTSGWVRARLRKRWLGKLQLEPGAREAMVTISGYVGTSIAIMVALSVAGFGLSNLAIIAGALSVGIGFGLQNIVNNFVSGLILLFERPIKTGDWIVVGSTEGFVRHIRIRSTQIQTFDRADVIVPNSELISGQVTNWMLRDPGGRVRIQVGVAYGSDTAQVRDLLLGIGAGHPLVIRDDPERAVKVFFLSFGDSALNFELQCHIGHIGQRQQVISDINFSIDAEFRKHAIEMPFPQSDVHVRDLPPGWNGAVSPRTPETD